jgi:hypothetical protein
VESHVVSDLSGGESLLAQDIGISGPLEKLSLPFLVMQALMFAVRREEQVLWVVVIGVAVAVVDDFIRCQVALQHGLDDQAVLVDVTLTGVGMLRAEFDEVWPTPDIVALPVGVLVAAFGSAYPLAGLCGFAASLERSGYLGPMLR